MDRLKTQGSNLQRGIRALSLCPDHADIRNPRCHPYGATTFRAVASPGNVSPDAPPANCGPPQRPPTMLWRNVVTGVACHADDQRRHAPVSPGVKATLCFALRLPRPPHAESLQLVSPRQVQPARRANAAPGIDSICEPSTESALKNSPQSTSRLLRPMHIPHEAPNTNSLHHGYATTPHRRLNRCPSVGETFCTICAVLRGGEIPRFPPKALRTKDLSRASRHANHPGIRRSIPSPVRAHDDSDHVRNRHNLRNFLSSRRSRTLPRHLRRHQKPVRHAPGTTSPAPYRPQSNTPLRVVDFGPSGVVKYSGDMALARLHRRRGISVHPAYPNHALNIPLEGNSPWRDRLHPALAESPAASSAL